jgi:integrase
VKLTKDTVAKLALPAGKSEHVIWDDDIPGFGIRLRPNSGTYFFRYRHGARQPRIVIGKTTAVTAQQARATAAQHYARTKLGEDPAGVRAEARTRANETFELALKPYLAHKQATLRPRSFVNLNRHLTKHAAPLHRLELAKAAERRRVAELLTKIADSSGSGEANSVKGSLSGFYVWAIGRGLLDGSGVDLDPTIGIPNAPINGPRSHIPTDDDIVRIWGALHDGDNYSDIIKLLALMLCRRTEIGGLRHAEIDFETDTINLPGERTKMGVPRAVPMSKPVRDILWRRHQQWDGVQPLVFSATAGGFTGWASAKVKLDRESGVVGWTHHDLRRYGSTVMNNEGIALPHIVDAAIGHRVIKHVTEHGQILSGKTAERHYNYATYPQQVRAALELWAQRVTRLVSGELRPAEVLALRRRKGA